MTFSKVFPNFLVNAALSAQKLNHSFKDKQDAAVAMFASPTHHRRRNQASYNYL